MYSNEVCAITKHRFLINLTVLHVEIELEILVIKFEDDPSLSL